MFSVEIYARRNLTIQTKKNGGRLRKQIQS